MTLDRATGTLFVPEIGLSIPSNLTRHELLGSQTAKGGEIAIGVQNEPWCSFNLPQFPQFDTNVHVTLQFEGEKLTSTQLLHDSERFGSSWTTFSETKEMARKMFHDQWLTIQLGVPSGRYAWGKIDSSYDSKGGFSSIMFSYT